MQPTSKPSSPQQYYGSADAELDDDFASAHGYDFLEEMFPSPNQWLKSPSFIDDHNAKQLDLAQQFTPIESITELKDISEVAFSYASTHRSTPQSGEATSSGGDFYASSEQVSNKLMRQIDRRYGEAGVNLYRIDSDAEHVSFAFTKIELQRLAHFSFKSFFYDTPTKAKACDKLVTKANEYLAHFHCTQAPALPRLEGFDADTASQALVKLFDTGSNGVVIGEKHIDTSSKRILIQSIPSLVNAGVNTLCMEHICSDVHGQALNEYLSSDAEAPMPARLASFLALLDDGQSFFRPHPEWNYTRLVETAKQHNMNIVALDTVASYDQAQPDYHGGLLNFYDNPRIKVFNFLAAEKIRFLDPDTKWIALVGSSHCNTIHLMPGIAELTRSRSVIIQDADALKIESGVAFSEYELEPDLVISAPSDDR